MDVTLPQVSAFRRPRRKESVITRRKWKTALYFNDQLPDAVNARSFVVTLLHIWHIFFQTNEPESVVTHKTD